MNLHVRKLNYDDVPFIYYVFEQNRDILHGEYISLQDWQNYFSRSDLDPYESHYIITADETPAAWLKLNGWNKAEIHISMLVVEDKFKHKGVGKFAIQFAEEEAKAWVKSAILIQTTKDNIFAKECYLKCGYDIIREMVYAVGDGVSREGYEFRKNLIPDAITERKLNLVLSKMFDTDIIRSDFQIKQLQNGTVGDIRLLEGNAQTADASILPFKIVLKVQKKWNRYGDPDSWRREYDFYQSDLESLFSESLRWPECYHSEMNEAENETQIWMEYIDGVSGLDLTCDMFEKAAEELGRFKGRLYADNPYLIQNLTNLSKLQYTKESYLHYRSWKEVYDYIRKDDCEIPKHLCRMLIDIDENEVAVWDRIEKLPIVLCHKDFWITNIFYKDEKIILIDWDTSGWGYMGEDIASLIADESDVNHMLEYYQRCIPAYYKGFSEYADISTITDNCIREFIIIKFGYRLVECFKFAKSQDEKTLHLNTLQKIYEMGN